MVKKSITTRMDEDVLDLARRLATMERRSMTAILELAVIEYAKARGHEAPANHAGPTVPGTGPKAAQARGEKP